MKVSSCVSAGRVGGLPDGTVRSDADTPIQPSYAASFVCIGADCEDPCCHGWNIPVDRETYERYGQFPPEGLGGKVAQYVSIKGGDADPSQYAELRMTGSGACPFYGADRLCGIQKEYGGQLLSASCSIYPRVLNQVEGVLEGSLMLSCPEAAKKILLVENSTRQSGDLLAADFRKDIVYRLPQVGAAALYKPVDGYKAVREWLVRMVQDRSRPLWQRLLLVGSLCKRLSEISAPNAGAAVSDILAEYRQILGTDWANAELEKMQTHAGARLKIILRLTGLVAREISTGERYRNTCRMFTEGIGLAPDANSGAELEGFQQAELGYYLPFLEKRPFILENYLLNYMFQTLFPFGRDGSVNFIQRDVFDEYLLMTTQFGWVVGLLIGVAGFYKEQFAEEHVVQTIQSVCREVEHAQPLLTTMLEFLRAYSLDNMAGMALLLKS